MFSFLLTGRFRPDAAGQRALIKRCCPRDCKVISYAVLSLEVFLGFANVISQYFWCSFSRISDCTIAVTYYRQRPKSDLLVYNVSWRHYMVVCQIEIAYQVNLFAF